jgi:hypothetical protein
MTANIERRVEALEANAGRADKSMRVVVAEIGETADQALHRLGIEADAKDVLVVVFEAASKGEE